VYGGALRYGGMGAFSDILSRSDVAAVKAFIVDDEIGRRSGKKSGAAKPLRYH
jgi:hypothetical protein